MARTEAYRSAPSSAIHKTVNLMLLKLRGVVIQPKRTFTNYEDALLEAGANGYQGLLIADVVQRKTTRIADGTVDPQETHAGVGAANIVVGVVTAKERAGHQDGFVRVLDVGGACGAHYFCAVSVVKCRSVRWCVVETPSMAAQAREFARQDLKFTTSLDQAQE